MTNTRILVIEDEFLVAVDIQMGLTNGGFGLVEHAATEKEALRRIHDEHWDGAVADGNLNGRGIGRVAAALHEHRIPFVIVTGYSRDSLPPEVAHVPFLAKPLDGRRLTQELSRVIAQYEPGE